MADVNHSASESSPDKNGMLIEPDNATQTPAADSKTTEGDNSRWRMRLGCFAVMTVLLVPLLVYVYFNFMYSPPLRISKETTYITQPLNADGTRVDYFAALEQELYPPEMKTDDNGYRMIVRAVGVPHTNWLESIDDTERSILVKQVYEKLGLDPAEKPTMTFAEPFEFLREYAKREGFDDSYAFQLENKTNQPWTLDDLPMMEDWLKQSDPVLDLIEQAVRKPTFCLPRTRLERGAIFDDSGSTIADIQTMRAFARMFKARAQYRIGTGDIDGAMTDVISCIRLGRHLESHHTIVDHLVGSAILGIARHTGIAAVRDSQPTLEQLRHFVDELNAIPAPLGMDEIQRTERYHALDYLQGLAMGDDSLAKFLEMYRTETNHPGPIANFSVDWNVAMQRFNEHYDDWGIARQWERSKLLATANLSISQRSLLIGDLMADCFMPHTENFVEMKHRSTCQENIQRIVLALLIYEREHGHLPPAYTSDAAGQALHSWRVLLLPYLGESTLFAKLRLDEPWDSQHNSQFHSVAPTIYQCPSTTLLSGETSYSVTGGEGTAFPSGKGKSLDDLEINLILVVERKLAITWMNPTSELTRKIAIKGVGGRDTKQDGIGSPHNSVSNIGLRDGSASCLTETIDPQDLKALIDGVAVKPDL